MARKSAAHPDCRHLILAGEISAEKAYMALCRNGVVLLYTVGAAGAGYVYLRIFRGWRLSDLMYVTRSSLVKSMSSVTAGASYLPQVSRLVGAYSNALHDPGLQPSFLKWTCTLKRLQAEHVEL